MGEFKIEEEDLYELLDIRPEAPVSDIKKAYRKKALKCHPDKNPNNPDAAKLFHQLTKILEVLTDESARCAYDKVLRGKKEAALRHQELDSKRRKLKEDLEVRERYAANNYFRTSTHAKSDGEKLREEIERLRKEGSQLVEEEMEYIRKKLVEESSKACESTHYRIKIKWEVAKGDSTNGGYTQEMLKRFLSKYGDVTGLVMSPKKRGSALVEFSDAKAAGNAIELERGLAVNPLALEWVDGPPSTMRFVHSSTIKPSDYESVVLTKLRQAEERKRLIEQILEEEKDI